MSKSKTINKREHSPTKRALQPEVLGPEPEGGPNLPADVDQYALRVAYLHDASKRLAHGAVLCAGMAGAVMLQKKHSLGHGKGFTAWKKQLAEERGISASTADNYIALAKQLDERVRLFIEQDPKSEISQKLLGSSNSQRVGNLPAMATVDLLASINPEDFEDLRTRAVAEAIREITGEQTLRQLYFDWGIVKRAKKTGGDVELQAWLKENHPELLGTKLAKLPAEIRAEFEAYVEGRKPTDEEILEAEREDAKRYWLRVRTDLVEFGVKDNPTWGLLNDQHLLETMVTFDTLAKRIKRALNERGVR